MPEYSKEQVHYRPGDVGDRMSCGNCVHLVQRPAQMQPTCELVNGVVAKNDVCDMWELASSPTGRTAKRMPANPMLNVPVGGGSSAGATGPSVPDESDQG